MTDRHLHLVKSTTSSDKSGAMSPPMRMLRDRAERHFVARLKVVLDQVDDTFFDLADSADNHRQQTHYFDAMRLIRVERKAIERSFVGAVSKAFDRLIDPDLEEVKPITAKSGSNGFELVADDELEEIIALDTMVSKSEELCQQQLQQICRRLDTMAAYKVTSKTNPLGPDVVCDAFFKSVEGLDIGIRSKLVLMKLFDRHVVSTLAELLRQSNQLLEELGISPVSEARKPTPPKRPANQRPVGEGVFREEYGYESGNSPGFGESEAQKSNYGRLVAQLNSVLARQKGLSMPAEGGEGRGRAYNLDDVLEAVTSIQLESIVQADGDQEPSLVEAITQQLYASRGEASLSPRDQGVIHLVDSMFKRVRSHHGLASSIEPEMRGLEMAIMKVALKDPTFFDKERHPARRLINEVAQASIGFDPQERLEKDPLYQKIHDVLQQLQNAAGDDTTLTRLLTDFIAFVDKERRRSASKERRLLEEEAARARLNFSHLAVKRELESRLLGLELPKITLTFVEQAWGNVLFLSHLRDGPGSDSWRASLHILDEVIDLSVLGHEAFSLRQAMQLLESVRNKLDEVALDPYQAEHLVRGMEQLLQAGVAGAINKLERQRVDSVSPSIPGEEDAEQDDVADQDVDEAHLHDIESIERGAWVQFQTPEQGTRRARFAGLVGPGERLLFVNRTGDKVAEGSRQRMAVELKNQNLILLDNSPMFDRALAGIVKDIRDGKSPISPS